KILEGPCRASSRRLFFQKRDVPRRGVTYGGRGLDETVKSCSRCVVVFGHPSRSGGRCVLNKERESFSFFYSVCRTGLVVANRTRGEIRCSETSAKRWSRRSPPLDFPISRTPPM